MSYLDKVIERTSNFTAACSKDSRKKYGQFFTSESSAIFMASLFNVDPSKPSLRILDAGAGTGILSVALSKYHADPLSKRYPADGGGIDGKAAFSRKLRCYLGRENQWIKYI